MIDDYPPIEEKLNLQQLASQLMVAPTSLHTRRGMALRRSVENTYRNPREEILREYADKPEELTLILDIFPDICTRDCWDSREKLKKHTAFPKIMGLFHCRELLYFGIPEEDLRQVMIHLSKTDPARFVQWHGIEHCTTPWQDKPHWIEIEKMPWLEFEYLHRMERNFYGFNEAFQKEWPCDPVQICTPHAKALAWWLRATSVSPQIPVVNESYAEWWGVVLVSRLDVQQFPEIFRRAETLFNAKIKDVP